jgi:ribonuclease HII
MLLSNFTNDKIEAGCDEAGRGCLAGPVFAASVILPKDYKNTKLNDSKILSEKQRNKLRIEIINDAIAWKVALVDNIEIDKINILNASILAMQKAVAGLETVPELLLIDGNRFKSYKNIPHHCIIKGDGKYMSISAASILAKTFRDEYITEVHENYPEYNWKQNKGYATFDHIQAILEYGRCPLHRFTFHLKVEQLNIEF